MQGFENIKELNFCKKNKIEPVIHNEYQLREVARLKKRSFENIWIKFNTGMNRLGFDVKEANNIFKKIYFILYLYFHFNFYLYNLCILRNLVK